MAGLKRYENDPNKDVGFGENKDGGEYAEAFQILPDGAMTT